MKLEITDAEDLGDKIIFKMSYDEEFAYSIARACGVKYASEEQVENLVMMVLEDMSNDNLRELGYEID